MNYKRTLTMLSLILALNAYSPAEAHAFTTPHHTYLILRAFVKLAVKSPLILVFGSKDYQTRGNQNYFKEMAEASEEMITSPLEGIFIKGPKYARDIYTYESDPKIIENPEEASKIRGGVTAMGQFIRGSAEGVSDSIDKGVLKIIEENAGLFGEQTKESIGSRAYFLSYVVNEAETITREGAHMLFGD